MFLDRRQEALEESESASFRRLHELVGIPIDTMRGFGVLPHVEAPSVAAVKERQEAYGFEASAGPAEEHGDLRLCVYNPSGYNLVFVERPA